MQSKSVDVLRVGKVFSVNGRKIEILVDKTKNSSHLLFNGEILRNVSVGSFVKITKGFSQLIGKIESEFITEDKDYSKSEYKKDAEKIKRILTVSLVGYLDDNSFEQGIKELPLIDNECYILTEKEYNQVHKFTKDGEETIKIGELASETSRNIELGVNSLFASHIGIFGNTGSGKSYTLASIYHSLFRKYQDNSGFKKNARFLLIDFNGEYANKNSIIQQKTSYKLNTTEKTQLFDKIPIRSKLIKDVNFWSILLRASEQTQKPFLESTFKNNFLNENINNIKGVKRILSSTLEKIFTQVTPSQDANYHISFLEQLEGNDGDKIFPNIRKLIDFYKKNIKLWSEYNKPRRYDLKINGKVIYSDSELELFIKTAITKKVESLEIKLDEMTEFHKIRIKIINSLYFSIQKGFYNREHISPLLNRLNTRLNEFNNIFKESDDDLFKHNNLAVVSLKDISNQDIKKIVPLIIVKNLYENQKKTNDKSKYLNIIIDEAHNILSYSSMRESETWKDYRLETFEEIIKEGRKFGTFLTIASQRPYDISPTIVSQLHNYLLHRLINNQDIEAIERTVAYLDKVSFESMPILPTGTCILAGLSAKIPVVVKINELEKEYEPNSHTIELTKYWGDEKNGSGDTIEKNDIQINNKENTASEDSFVDDLPF